MAQLIVHHGTGSTLSTLGYLCLCIPPVVGSAAALLLLLLKFRVDTPHFYRLTNSVFVLLLR